MSLAAGWLAATERALAHIAAGEWVRPLNDEPHYRRGFLWF